MTGKTTSLDSTERLPGRGRCYGSVAAWVLWVLAGVALSPGAFGTAPSSELEALRDADPALRAQSEIATTSETYLVLDLSVPRLRLMNGGAVLRDYPIAAMAVGRPEVAFIPRTATAPVRGGVWHLDRLDPPRVFHRAEVLPPGPGEEPATPPVPLEPSEACPAPDRYYLRFEDGLSIEVVQETSARMVPRLSFVQTALWRLHDLGQSISPRPEIRLRIVMSGTEAGALYRSVPTPVQLVVF